MTYTAGEIASVVKGTTVHGLGGLQSLWTVSLSGPDQITAVAVALAAQSAGSAALWLPGFGGSLQAQATQMVGAVGTAKEPDGSTVKRGNQAQVWQAMPYYANGRYQLYIPQATAALATATAQPNTGGNQTPGVSGALAAGAAAQADVTSAGQAAVQIVNDVRDPLFWRQVWFIGGGWLLVGIAVFQLVNRGFIQPVTGAVRQVDNVAYDAASFKANVSDPFKAFLRHRASGAEHRKLARGDVLSGRKRGLGSRNPLNRPNELPRQMRPKADTTQPPPPAKSR